MDHKLLINYISEVTKKAEANSEASNSGYIHFIVPQVRVIGEERLKSVTTLVDKAILKAKQVVFPIFGAEGYYLSCCFYFFRPELFFS